MVVGKQQLHLMGTPCHACAHSWIHACATHLTLKQVDGFIRGQAAHAAARGAGQRASRRQRGPLAITCKYEHRRHR